MRRLLGGLSIALSSSVLAAPEGPPLKLVCQSPGSVFSCRCPKLDPARTRLVSIQADLSGKRTLEFMVSASKVQDVTVNATGNMLLDPGFGWPASGTTTVQAGPSLNPGQTQTGTIDVSSTLSKLYTEKLVLDSFRGTGDRKLTSSNDWKVSTPTPGAQASYLAPKSNLTSVRLEYTYRTLLVPNAPVGSLSLPKPGVASSAPKNRTTVASLKPKTVACSP